MASKVWPFESKKLADSIPEKYGSCFPPFNLKRKFVGDVSSENSIDYHSQDQPGEQEHPLNWFMRTFVDHLVLHPSMTKGTSFCS